MKTVQCSPCDVTADVPLENGKQPDMPTGWSQLTIAERGQRVRGDLLCPDCTLTVRQALERRRTVPA